MCEYVIKNESLLVVFISIIQSIQGLPYPIIYIFAEPQTFFLKYVDALSTFDHSLVMLKESDLCVSFYSFKSNERRNYLYQYLKVRVQDWSYLYGYS